MFFGVDNTFLSRALDAGDLRAVRRQGRSTSVPAAYQLDPTHRVTPIDYGDVCINYDKQWFAEQAARGADDARRPHQARVQGPARRREPGDVVARARVPCSRRVAKYGDDGWRDYWKRLRANDVKVVDGWEQAYDGDFSAGAGQGDYPLVVSYASSPPAEVYYAEAARRRPSPIGTCSPTRASARSSSPACCKGAEHPKAARRARRLHARRAVPGRHPAADVRVPGRATGTPLPPRVHEVRRRSPAHPLHAAAGRDRRQPRRRGSSSGPTPCCGDRARPPGRSPRGSARSRAGRRSRVVFLGGLLRLARSSRSSGAGSCRSGALDLDPLGDVLTDPGLRHVAWFTVWQAALSTVLTLAVGLPGAYVLSRYRFRGRRARARARHGAVRAPDGRRRRRRSGAARRSPGSRRRRSCSPTSSSTTRSSCARSAGSGRTSTPGQEEAAQMLGASRWRTFRRRDAARAAARDRRRGRRSCSCSASRRSA